MSIRLRISLLFTLLVTLILLLLSLTVYYFAAVNRKSAFKTRLRTRAVSTAQVYAALGGSNLDILDRMNAGSVSSLYNKSVTLLDSLNQPVYTYNSDPHETRPLPQDILDKAGNGEEYYFVQGDKEGIAIRHDDSTHHFIVGVAAYDMDGRSAMAGLRQILVVAFLAGILITLLSGYLFASQLVKPLARITRQVNLITSNNLSQRIETTPSRDELNRLSLTFNDLLDRLQASFEIQRRFISHASHELSTPLTAISSQLEVTLHKDRDPEEYRRVMASIYEDVEQMKQLTRSLLEIAKAGSQGSIDLSEVRVDEIILKVAADVEKQNPSYHVSPDFGEFPEEERQMVVFGNADLLYSAFKNLAENGCKYSADQRAFLNLRFQDKMVEVTISSKGDVIAESDIQQIFEPFFRAGSVQDKPGFGLGLTLTRRIISIHKGRIRVSSDPELGTTFTITLPSLEAYAG
ncbi:MAG TPA: HAMP domain-containing sensor histidine kinase [Chitinophagaceae bacterium]|nr:HAMP domain-containing sensor histidine kinase [Chitinophagaceae bacterium]